MRERLFDIVCGLLIVIGSLVFVNGGRQHPATDSRLGPAGSEAYFRAFAERIVHEHHWETMHGQILVGPVLWALGAAGLRRRFAAARWHDVATVALTVGCAAWVVAFVFDGFVAPVLASGLVETPAGEPDAALDLRANQLVVIRAGLIGWVLIGVGIGALGAAIGHDRRFSYRLLALFGVAIGLWPLAAWLGGAFVPGPFVSALWRPTAIVTAAWFLLAGAALFASPHGKPENPLNQAVS